MHLFAICAASRVLTKMGSSVWIPKLHDSNQRNSTVVAAPFDHVPFGKSLVVIQEMHSFVMLLRNGTSPCCRHQLRKCKVRLLNLSSTCPPGKYVEASANALPRKCLPTPRCQLCHRSYWNSLSKCPSTCGIMANFGIAQNGLSSPRVWSQEGDNEPNSSKGYHCVPAEHRWQIPLHHTGSGHLIAGIFLGKQAKLRSRHPTLERNGQSPVIAITAMCTFLPLPVSIPCLHMKSASEAAKAKIASTLSSFAKYKCLGSTPHRKWLVWTWPM